MLGRVLTVLQCSQCQYRTQIIKMSVSSYKPPNILVQSSTNTSTALLDKVVGAVNLSKYVVYPIQTTQLLTSPWAKNTILLILQESLATEALNEVVKFVDAGGKVLDFSTNIDKSAQGYKNVDCDIESLGDAELEGILRNDFHIETTKERETDYSAGYIVANADCLNAFFGSKRFAEGRKLIQSKMTLDFSPTEKDKPTEKYLPIKMEEPPSFNSSMYLTYLNTTSLGQPLVFVPVISSSMVPFSGGPIHHGFAVIPQRQLSGRGRGNNKWLSPAGCSMFSLQIILKTTSFLGSRSSLMQHLVTLAQVHAIRRMEEYKDIDIRIKWPNDVYYGKIAKLGGVIAQGTIFKDDIIITIGAGINLNNENPTTSINQVVVEKGKEKISQEELLGNTFNVLEEMIEKCNNGLFAEVEALYYKYWLHTDQRIKIMEEAEEKVKNVKVVGIDEFGYLKVIDDNNQEFTVFDDGNSFDMMEGLIRPKSSQ